MILGHSNNVYCKSIKKQVKKGSNYGNENINEFNYIKSLKKKFNEFDTFIFSNSGSEANIRALRISRTTKNKEIVAMLMVVGMVQLITLCLILKMEKKLYQIKLKVCHQELTI